MGIFVRILNLAFITSFIQVIYVNRSRSYWKAKWFFKCSSFLSTSYPTLVFYTPRSLNNNLFIISLFIFLFQFIWYIIEDWKFWERKQTRQLVQDSRGESDVFFFVCGLCCFLWGKYKLGFLEGQEVEINCYLNLLFGILSFKPKFWVN